MSLVYGLSNPSDMLKKLRRAQVRLNQAISNENDIAIGDAIFDFSVTGYHVLDWVKKGSDLGTEADTLLARSPELQACRDICNSSKHFKIDRYVPKTKDVYFSAPPLRETVLEMKGAIKILMSDGQKFEVGEFASRIVKLWEEFYDQTGLGVDT